jgi:hypothetical protein
MSFETASSDKINVSICPKCGDRVKLPFSLFYTNSKKQFAVWWEPEKDEAIDRDVDGYVQHGGKNNYLAVAPRITDWEEFKETIRKYERGELKCGTAMIINQTTQAKFNDFLETVKKTKRPNNSVLEYIKKQFLGNRNGVSVSKDKMQGKLLILKEIYEIAFEFNKSIENVFYYKSSLVTFEMYTFLFCLTDYFLNINGVGQEIRSDLLGLSFNGLQTADGWSKLNLDKKEIQDYTLDRMLRYAKIFNELKVFTTECVKNLIFYQSQLFLEIIENKKLSMFNPNSEDPWDYGPINMDFFKTHKINVLLQEFYIETILPQSKIMLSKYTKEYFAI